VRLRACGLAQMFQRDTYCLIAQTFFFFFLNSGTVSHSYALCTKIRWAGASNPGGERTACAALPNELRAEAHPI
jgi:hypothetical protein